MVYSFAIGCAIGIPFGCYMREHGLHRRLQTAYKVLVPGDQSNPNYTARKLTFGVEPKMEQFRNTGKEFYDDLKRGKTETKDFERYIYGSSQNKYKDDRDRAELEARSAHNSLERDFTDKIETLKAQNKV